MKRLVISLIAALVVHAILLGTEFSRFRQIPAVHLKPDTLTVSLSMQRLAKSTKTTKEHKHDILSKKTEHLKSPAQKPKKTPPEPKKQTVQPKKTEVSTIVAPAPPSAESELKKSHKALEMTEPYAEDVSTPAAIRKVQPFYRTNPRPKYPRIARTRGYQGNVVLEVLVDRQGEVSDLRVFKSSGYSILDKAAEEAVKNWLFEPGMIGKEKVAMWVRIPVRFELE